MDENVFIIVYQMFYLKTLDLIVGKIGLLIDLLKVNVSVGIRLAWVQRTFLRAVSLHFHILIAAGIRLYYSELLRSKRFQVV